MVITKIKGGLGNQMFQYAAGTAIALRTGQPLKADLSFVNEPDAATHTRRELGIGSFNVNLLPATDKELSEAASQGVISRLLGRVKYTRINDSVAHRRRFDSASGDVYLDGYWQSEYYFSDAREILLREFTLRDEIPFNQQGFDVSDKNNVGVHVRRGDYVTLPSANQFHGVLSMEYYQRALAEIQRTVPNAKIFVFSDDVAWCKTAFAGLNVHGFIDGKNNPPAHDLMLMAKCAHQVIANSSFSWWAAWLNQNPAKVVIAPKQWFRENRKGQESIYCKGWITH